MSALLFLPPPFRRPTAVRAALLWIFLRAVSTSGAVELLELPVQDALRWSALNSLWMAAFVSTAVWIEMMRRDEAVFLANLGISSRRVFAVVCAQSLLMDLALGLLVV